MYAPHIDAHQAAEQQSSHLSKLVSMGLLDFLQTLPAQANPLHIGRFDPNLLGDSP